MSQGRGALIEEWTHCEQSVLRALTAEASQREIGASLYRSINTVEGYTKALPQAGGCQPSGCRHAGPRSWPDLSLTRGCRSGQNCRIALHQLHLSRVPGAATVDSHHTEGADRLRPGLSLARRRVVLVDDDCHSIATHALRRRGGIHLLWWPQRRSS